MAAAIGGYALWRSVVAELGPLRWPSDRDGSTIVLDRSGRLLRAFTTQDGRWRLPVEAKDVDQRYLAMLIAFEDRRFLKHHGVDPLATLRAG
jgi:penicillin-binding protein 1C